MILFVSCSISPNPIRVGKDDCHFCKMKIMDKRYGAEIVTKKNKSYKFDSFECLVGFINSNEIDKNAIELTLVTDFNSPNELINASGSSFLISKDLPSPMGAYITAFGNIKSANEIAVKYPGEIVNYANVCDYIKDLQADQKHGSCCHKE